ncbi:MAG TPA: VOC family protein, partial [Gammaproteobacteria bacterium]|nr:VOC family protein [Gammaproteobacteria bacterium]
PLERRVQDSGAATLIVVVRDIDATLARLEGLGAPVVTRGGAPVTLPFGEQKARMVVVRDPDGHFVELVQPERMPATAAPATSNVVDVRVRLTVEDVEKSLRLYRDALGLEAVDEPASRDDPAVAAALGAPGAAYRIATLRVPTSGLLLELADFKGVDRRPVRGDIEDPGSTRMQLQVRDIDAAVAALEDLGGTVVSTDGKPLELPVPGSAIEVAIVRDPDNLFLVLIESPPRPR